MSDNHQGGGKFKPIIIYKTAELLQRGLLNNQCTGRMFDDYGIDCPHKIVVTNDYYVSNLSRRFLNATDPMLS